MGGEGAGGRVIPAVAVVGVAGGVAAADVGQGAGVAEQVGGGQAAVVGQDPVGPLPTGCGAWAVRLTWVTCGGETLRSIL